MPIVSAVTVRLTELTSGQWRLSQLAYVLTATGISSPCLLNHHYENAGSVPLLVRVGVIYFSVSFDVLNDRVCMCVFVCVRVCVCVCV